MPELMAVRGLGCRLGLKVNNLLTWKNAADWEKIDHAEESRS